MTAKRKLMPKDDNGKAIQAMKLNDSEDIDGTLISAVSSAINGTLVRICAIDGDIRFEVGATPVAVVDSNFLGDHQEIWVPCNEGDQVAILGGKANIATAGV